MEARIEKGFNFDRIRDEYIKFMSLKPQQTHLDCVTVQDTNDPEKDNQE